MVDSSEAFSLFIQHAVFLIPKPIYMLAYFRPDLLPLLMKSPQRAHAIAAATVHGYDAVKCCLDTGATFSDLNDALGLVSRVELPITRSSIKYSDVEPLLLSRLHQCNQSALPSRPIKATWDMCSLVLQIPCSFHLILPLCSTPKEILLLALQILTDKSNCVKLLKEISHSEGVPKLPNTYLSALPFATTMLKVSQLSFNLILDFGCDVNTPFSAENNDGGPFFHVATKQFKSALDLVFNCETHINSKHISSLLDHGATLHPGEKCPNLFLHLCKNQHEIDTTELVEVLLAHGMTPFERGPDNLSALDFLVQQTHQNNRFGKEREFAPTVDSVLPCEIRAKRSLLNLVSSGLESYVEPYLRFTIILWPTLPPRNLIFRAYIVIKLINLI